MKVENGLYISLMKSMVYNLICRYKKFLKFGFVAVGYNLVAYFIYVSLIFIKCDYIVASTVSFISGVALSYVMNKNLVFSIKSGHNLGLVIRYFSFYLALLVINLAMLHCIVQWFNINLYLAQILTTIIAALVSYNTMQRFVFKKN